jgi:hypothetical protein
MSRKIVIVGVLAVVVLIVLARRAAASKGPMVYTGTRITPSVTANIRKAAIDAAMGINRAPMPNVSTMYGVK